MGRPCEFMNAVDLDLVFVLDSSDNINDEDFQKMISGVANAVENTFPTYDSKFGLMLFASDNEIRIPLEKVTNKEDLANKIRGQTRINGDRSTKYALQRTFNDIWTTETNLDPSKSFIIFEESRPHQTKGPELLVFEFLKDMQL